MFIQGKTDISPQEAGYDPRAITNLENLFTDLMKREKIQCAGFLLARGGKIFAHKTTGRLRYNDPDKLYMPDSIRRIASITKVFTTISVMRLIEDGLLYLEQPVATIIPAFDNNYYNKITLFHLLTHTSGLSAAGSYFLEPYPRWTDGETMDEFILDFLRGPVQAQPGEQWAYSNRGFAVLGEVVARVSGMPYEEFVKKIIINPLGMTDTHFSIDEELKERYCLVSEDEEKRVFSKDKKNFYKAAGGLSSNAFDLFKLAQLILNKGEYKGIRILGRKTLEAMCRNRMGDNMRAYYWGADHTHWHYGIGLELLRENLMSEGTLSHGGVGRCDMFIDPSEDFIAVHFVPSAIYWNPETIENPRSIIWSGIL